MFETLHINHALRDYTKWKFRDNYGIHSTKTVRLNRIKRIELWLSSLNIIPCTKKFPTCHHYLMFQWNWIPYCKSVAKNSLTPEWFFLFLLRRAMCNCASYRPSFIVTMKIRGCDVTGYLLIKRGCYIRHMSLFWDERLFTPRLPPELQTHPLWSLSMAFSWPESKSCFLLSQSIEASYSDIRGQIYVGLQTYLHVD